MPERININRGWLYCPNNIEGAQAPDFDDSSWERVNVPHTNKLLPHHNFDDKEYQFIYWYRKRITMPDADRVFLDFDAVMIACEVYVNGEFVCEHKGGYTPFSVDLSGMALPGEELLVAVRVDSTERKDIPPFGNLVDYLTFSGIYRDVWLRTCGKSYIENVFLKSRDLFDTPKLIAEVSIVEPAKNQGIKLALKDIQGNEVAETFYPGSAEKVTVTLEDLYDIELWSIEEPNLYWVEVILVEENGGVADYWSTKFGFRDARFCEDGAFRLNGKPVKLIGLDRHQSYPYIGYAAPWRLQVRDADILKRELSLNIVRTSHYPQSPHFLDRCDEIGLLVLEEIPGWSYIGDDDWKNLSKQDVRDMIIRDRNHPCIVLWGVRINESQDDTDFYTETNRIAHELDPTRQTGGIRCHWESEALEDVFTYNDFSNMAREPNHIPYLITEFAGHTFPTKSWDPEERKVEHALLHAKVQSRQMLNPRISGAIGWCAFDYNTHNSFGSGDRMCYHGVSDIFRLPKWAAYFYESQADPKNKVVLRVASNWTMGDRSGGGLNPLVIFSNCDYVDVYVGNDFHGRHYPAIQDYPGLKHPPFIIPMNWLWGDAWQDARIEGYVAGKKVAEVRRTNDPLPSRIKLWPDSNWLFADGQDMTSLNFQIVDKYDNVLPYTSQIITISAEGPVDIIGTNPFAPQGGQGAVYIKAKEEPGKAIVTASAPRLQAEIVEIELRECIE